MAIKPVRYKQKDGSYLWKFEEQDKVENKPKELPVQKEVVVLKAKKSNKLFGKKK